ncbi:uncharacterized protein LOC134263411 isoform X1 [Saccostrea cucullata]|uniref:uncharacterized protein LOC134263411 isoform X1 n=1 Tax=Saccostrea cuccullata TaxID=36930 RepID=UPI002ED31C1A
MEVAQMEQARFICLILFLGVSYGKQNGSSLCPTKNNREKCCSGYRMINKTCTECIGFFGEDCMSPCPLNFYGVNCDSECNCTEGEKCNPYVGCLHITSDNRNNTGTDLDFPIHNESCTLLLKLVLILGGSQIILLVFCFSVLLLKCCRLPPQNTKQNTERREISSTTQQTEIRTNHSPVAERSWNNINTRLDSRETNANDHHYDRVHLTVEEKCGMKSNHRSLDSNTYFTLQPMR